MNGILSCTESNRMFTLISLSCQSACCVLSITQWVYHAFDSVSTILGRQPAECDGWSSSLPQYHWLGLQSRASPNGPNYPLYPCFQWLCIGRMKYACIVYLRKSISFAHLQINRYNGIADFDLPSFWHSQFLYNYIIGFKNMLFENSKSDFLKQQHLGTIQMRNGMYTRILIW